MKPRISLRVNGTRIGEAARPTDDTVQRLPTRRAIVPRANASLLVRDYRDDDDAQRQLTQLARTSSMPRANASLLVRDYRDDDDAQRQLTQLARTSSMPRANASLLVRDYRDGTEDGGGELA